MGNILGKAFAISNYRFGLLCIGFVLVIYSLSSSLVLVIYCSLSSSPSFELLAPQPNLRLARDHGDDALSYLIPNQVDESINAYLLRQINTTTPSSIDPLKECSPTSQVRLHRTGNGDRNEEWTMQAIDAEGNDKTIGGDEFYITYADESNRTIGEPIHSNARGTAGRVFGPTAVAIIDDNHDGTYTLEFVAPPSRPYASTLANEDVSRGSIDVHFVFTCSIGMLYQPVKDNWITGGGTKIHHSLDGVPAPFIRPFRVPNQLSFNAYDDMYFVGDSLMRQMACNETAKYTTYSKKFRYANTNSDLSSTTIPHFLNMIENLFGESLRSNSSKAIVLNSGAWDVMLQGLPQGSDFKDHIETCRQYVLAVKENYTTADVIWKLPSELHFHRINPRCLDRNEKKYAGPWGGAKPCKNVIRYASSGRIGFLYEKQKELMRRLGIPMIDTYEATKLSGHEHRDGDIMHYTDDFNRRVLDWFTAPSEEEMNPSIYTTTQRIG